MNYSYSISCFLELACENFGIGDDNIKGSISNGCLFTSIKDLGNLALIKEKLLLSVLSNILST